MLPKVTVLPDRLCTWCKVPMRKRLVGGEYYVHYICPKCLFQHTCRCTLTRTESAATS